MASVLRFAARRYISTNQALLASSKGLQGPSAVSGGHEGGYKIWKKLTFFVAFPTIALCMINSYRQISTHPHERPEFVPYEHLRMRSKRFPWGDGQHSLFHNPHVNALPDGYED